jgi:hypothetical protein
MKAKYEAKLKAKKQIVITEEERTNLIERRDAALKRLRSEAGQRDRDARAQVRFQRTVARHETKKPPRGEA